MIDTITFLLHNINSHSIDLSPKNGEKVYKMPFNRLLYERLCEYETKFVYRNKKFLNDMIIENPDDDYFKRKQINTLGLIKRQGAIVETLNKKDFFFYPINGDIKTSSSDYRCKFSVNENSDSIKFELSIPKYFYNHNVAQFVPNIDSKRFKENPFLIREFNGQVKEIRQRIIEFIYTFFNDLSTLLDMPNIQDFDIRNIEVRRLDLCYNQVFQSHEMVLDYLNAQKKFYRSRTKTNTIVKDEMETSLYYRHSLDGFYFKIYSKGDEFKNVDYKKIITENKEYYYDNLKELLPVCTDIFKKYFPDTFKKVVGDSSYYLKNNEKIYTKVQNMIFDYYDTYCKNNDENSFVTEIEALFPFKLNFLMNEANKILRYEMSFTSTYMSTLYKRHIFRKNDKNWRKSMEMHNLIKRYDLLLSQGSINQAKEFKRRYNITNDMRLHYENIDKSLHKKHTFFLYTDKKVLKHENIFHDFQNLSLYKNYRIKEISEASLNQDLINLMFKKFKEEIDYFQVKEVQETKTLLEQIDLYNANVDKKVASFISAFGEKEFKKLTHTQKRNKGYSKIMRSRLKITIDKMNEGLSFQQVVTELGLKKSAEYTLKSDLEKFNIYKTSVKTKFNFKNVKTDFSQYYEKFRTDPNYHKKLFSNPYFISFDSLRDSMLEDYLKLNINQRINSLVKAKNLF